MRWLAFLLLVALSLHACQREISCEQCPMPPVTLRDTLPKDYPFSNGHCPGTKLLGVSIPFHDSARLSVTDVLPDSLLLDMPEAGDQGSQGSCSAWATVYAAGSYYAHIVGGKPYSDSTLLSPKYTYNQITKGDCVCTSITDHLYLLETQGASPLSAMPYDPKECLLQPDSLQKKKAEPFKIKSWLTVDIKNVTLIKQQLLHKMPVIFTTFPDEAFNRPSSPYIISKRTGNSAGGHAIVICGYNDAKKAFRIMNSWGKRWADNGFAWMEYSFAAKNAVEPLGCVITY
jgi:C1A family cysteine protease